MPRAVHPHPNRALPLGPEQRTGPSSGRSGLMLSRCYSFDKGQRIVRRGHKPESGMSVGRSTGVREERMRHIKWKLALVVIMALMFTPALFSPGFTPGVQAA